MKKAQSKDIIGEIIILVFLLLVGEGVFNWGGYLVLLLVLSSFGGWVYWLAFVVGLVISSLSGSQLGLASGFLILMIFVYKKLTVTVKPNVGLIFVYATLANFALDKLTGSYFGIPEILANGVLVIGLAAIGYLNDENN